MSIQGARTTAIPVTQIDAHAEPIACTLTPGGYATRTAELSALAAHALLSRKVIDGGQRLIFADTPPVEHELRAAIAAETSCCAFLSMILRRTDAGLVLDVTGPAGAKPIIAELFA